MSLSEEQSSIVHHPVDEHALVLAVAGSGKSHTMAERAAYLVEAKRFEPSQIIAVMFNTTAAEEFSIKLAKRLGKRNAPDSVTFHRLGTLMLNRLQTAGFAPKYEFEANTSRALKFAADVIAPACHRYGFKYPRMVADIFLNYVDRVKGDLATPEETWGLGAWEAKFEWFVGLYRAYEKARHEAKVRYFSDLIYDPVTTMMNDPAAAKAMAGRYQHIIVDEYQDICESQQALVRFAAGKYAPDKEASARVMVVGDDDQTIYTWRGAKPSYILRDFLRDFPGGKVYRLTRTWRYGPALSCSANYVITHNTDRADKLCISQPGKTPDTQLHLAWENEDGNAILKIVDEWLASGRKLCEIAVLIRTYSRSYSAQFALLQRGLAFRLEGGDKVSVLDNPWISTLLGWMDVAAGRVARRPWAGEPDMGAVIQMKSIIGMPALGVSYEAMGELAVRVLKEPDGLVAFNGFVRDQLQVADGDLAERVYRRGKLWRDIRALSNRPSLHPLNLANHLISTLEIEETIKRTAKNEDEAEEQLSLIKAFTTYIQKTGFKELQQFLDHVSDLRSFSDKAKKNTAALHMTSVHRSKGLEWPCVIMIGLSQGAFPHKPRKKITSPDGEQARIEDERRLFYVAMTRAREELHMLSPPDPLLHQWLRAGKSGSPESLPEDGSSASQFLYESNLYLSRAMSIMMQRPVALKAVDPGRFNDYLQEVGIHYRVQAIGESLPG